MAAMSWLEGLEWWAPTVAVAAMTLLALAAARRSWLFPVAVVGMLAMVGTVWQQMASRTELAREAERMRSLSDQLDEIARVLPRSGGGAGAEQSHSVNAVRSLTGKLHELETQVAALRERYNGRHVDADTAAKLTDYLRPHAAGNRVVVSCLPSDLEACNYGTQLANIFKGAGWDALGPETTTIYGDAPKLGVTLYVRGARGADSAKALVDAFAKFNIPYQSGLIASEMIPDATTVELFVAPKP